MTGQNPESEQAAVTEQSEADRPTPPEPKVNETIVRSVEFTESSEDGVIHFTRQENE